MTVRATAAFSMWHPRTVLLTAGLLLTIIGPAFETLAVATSMPATVAELGGLAWYGWAFSAFMLAQIVGITISGPLIDRHGPAAPYLLGMGTFASGLAVAGLATTMEVLIIGRVIQGFGGGFNASVVYAVVARAYPDRLRPRMLALVSLAWIVPGLLGPALAGVVVEGLGWRWVFLGLLPAILVALACTWPSLRQIAGVTTAPLPRRRAIDALLLALGVGIALGAPGLTPASLAWAGPPGAALPLWLVIPAMVACGAMLTIAMLRRLLPAGTLLVAAGLPAAIAIHLLVNLAFFGVDAFLPLALDEVRGGTAIDSALALTAGTVAWSLGAWLLERLANRLTRRLLTSLGIVLIALGVVSFIITLDPRVPLWFGIAGWGLAGLGMGLSYTMLTLCALDLAPAGGAGMASAALNLVSVLGIACATGLGGILVAQAEHHQLGAGPALALQGVLMVLVLLGALAATRRLPAGVRRAAADEPPSHG